MRIGTLKIWAFVTPSWILRLDKLLEIMLPLLKSVGIVIISNYTYVEPVRAILNWEVQLEQYWKNDRIYTVLRDYLNKNFTYWQLRITLSSKEKGG